MEFVKLTLATFQRIMRVVKEVEGIRGSGVQRIPGVGIVIRQTPATPQRLQRQPVSGGGTLLAITGNRTCGEVYSGYVVTPLSTDFNSSAATFGDSDIGTNQATEVTIINLNGRGQTSHSLTSGTPIVHQVVGHRLPRKDNAGRDVYAVNVVDLGDCA